MIAIEPYISFGGECRAAIEFYQQALDAEVQFVQTMGESPMRDMGPADNIMHCSMKVGESVLMMSDGMGPGDAGGSRVALSISVKDVEEAKRLFGNLAEGGTVTMPLEKTYWAAAFGMLTDRFGVKWMINCEAEG